MITNIELPDGSVRSFENAVTGFQLADSISKSLAKAAIAISVNNELLDLSTTLNGNCKVKIITSKDPEGLEIIRHDTAHILAQSIKELYPAAQITIGPVIENGFYYDVSMKSTITEEDLVALHNKMKEIMKRNDRLTREVWNREEAIRFFESIGEHYKAMIIADIPHGENISMYRQGDFIDLCRGPHAPSTGYPKAFKLLKVSGAYWRGDSKNEMLQRIYGTAWATEAELNAYIEQIAEAERRDHRKLGKELGLFHLQEEAPGQVFWHDRGYTLYKIIENYIRTKIKANGYSEVKTPQMADLSLWEKSGHAAKYAENMFTIKKDERIWALKPMNCPLHIQIFNQSLKSYRDLPLRMAEFGCCHRNESSGSMHGIMRVYGLTQDDAHIFCTEDQITEETVNFTKLLIQVYKDFGFTDINIKLSTRPELRAGTDEVWDLSEDALRKAVDATGLVYQDNPGEGAFYGPKLEYHLKDAIGREWQCGTLQVDCILPELLDANYIGADGNKHRPVILHRAILGSMERFIGILIEEHAGNFPLWLAPTQAIICTITNEFDQYAIEVMQILENSGIRVEKDLSSDKINYKIRKHSLNKIPLILVVGRNEAASNSVSVRRFGSDNQEILTIDDLITKISNEVVALG